MRSIRDRIVAAAITDKSCGSFVATRIRRGISGEVQIDIRRVNGVNEIRCRFARRSRLRDGGGARLQRVVIREGSAIPRNGHVLRIDRPRRFAGDGVIAIADRCNGQGVSIRVDRGVGLGLFLRSAGGLGKREALGIPEVRARKGHRHGIASHDVRELDGHAMCRRCIRRMHVVTRPSHRNGSLEDRTDADGLLRRGGSVLTQGVIRIADGHCHGLAGADVLIIIDRSRGEDVAFAHARKGDLAGNVVRSVIELGTDRRDRDAFRADHEGGRRAGYGVISAIRAADARDRHGVRARIDRRVSGGAARRIGERKIGARHAAMRRLDRDFVARNDVRNIQDNALRRLAINVRTVIREGERDRTRRDRDARSVTRQGVVRIAGDRRRVMRADVLAAMRVVIILDAEIVAAVNARVGGARSDAAVCGRSLHRPSLSVINRREGRRAAARRIRRGGIICRGPRERNRFRADRYALDARSGEQVVRGKIGRSGDRRIRDGGEGQGVGRGVRLALEVRDGSIRADVLDIRGGAVGVFEGKALALDKSFDRNGEDIVRRLVVRKVLHRRDCHGDRLRRNGADIEGLALRGAAVIIIQAVVRIGDRHGNRLRRTDVLCAFADIARACGEFVTATDAREGDIRGGDRRGAVIHLRRDGRDRDAFRADHERGRLGSVRIVAAVFARETRDRHGVRSRVDGGVSGGAARRVGERKIAARHAAMRRHDRDFVIRDDVRDIQGHALRFFRIDVRTVIREGERDRTRRDHNARLVTRQGIVRIAAKCLRIVSADRRAAMRAVQIGDAKTVAAVNARVGGTRRDAAVRSRRLHRPSLAIIDRREVRRDAARRIRRKRGIIRCAPSESNRLRADGHALRRRGGEQVVRGKIGRSRDRRIRNGSEGQGVSRGIRLALEVRDGSIRADVLYIRGVAVSVLEGKALALDKACDDHGEDIVRRFIIREVRRRRDRHGDRLRGDIRIEIVIDFRIRAIAVHRVVRIGEGISDGLIAADIRVGEGARDAEIVAAVNARRRRARRNAGRIGKGRRRRAVIRLIVRGDGDILRRDGQGVGRAAAEDIVRVIHAHDSHGVAARIRRGIRSVAARRRGEREIRARHAVMRRRNGDAIARDNVRRIQRDALRGLIVRAATIRREGDIDRPRRDGPGSGSRRHLVIGAEVLRRDADAVIIDVRREVALRINRRGAFGRIHREGSGRKICTAEAEGDGITRANIRDAERYAVRDLIIGHAARILRQGERRARRIVRDELD